MPEEKNVPADSLEEKNVESSCQFLLAAPAIHLDEGMGCRGASYRLSTYYAPGSGPGT